MNRRKENNSIIVNVDSDGKERCYMEIENKLLGKILCEVSRCDIDLLSERRWYVSRDSKLKSRWHLSVKTKFPLEMGGHTQTIGNFLLRPPKNLIVGHRNSDSLCNTRENLYIGTWSTIHANRTGTDGTFLDESRSNRQWSAGIVVNRKRISLGYFPTKEDARKVYLEARANYHPITQIDSLE